MPVEQLTTDSLPVWPPNTTATRNLDADFSRMVFEIRGLADFLVGGGLNTLLVSALAPITLKAFDWDAAERRADWEESHGRFVEFGDVKDLLSDLHS